MGTIKIFKFENSFESEGGSEFFPFGGGNFEFFVESRSDTIFFEKIIGWVIFVKKAIEFVPFDLESNESIGDVVDIGDRTNKIGNYFFVGVEIDDSVTTFGFNFFPGGDFWVASFFKNLRILAENKFFDFGMDFGKTVETIGEGGEIDFVGVVAYGVENRVHFEMRVTEGIDGDFEIGFESGTVGADVVFDGRDVGIG